MNIYLAARYSRWPQMTDCRTDLEALGHAVTSRWIDGDHQIDDGQTLDAQVSEKVRFAREDVADLLAAEVFIAFTEEPRSRLGTRGGRHVELGYALALGKRVIVVGWRENVFCWLPEVEFHDTWAAALDALRPPSGPSNDSASGVADTTDIVERLLSYACTDDRATVSAGDLREAVDEIVRLRDHCQRLEQLVDWSGEQAALAAAERLRRLGAEISRHRARFDEQDASGSGAEPSATPGQGVCAFCARRHRPDEPHNVHSKRYRIFFRAKVGRPPTWADAVAHCSDDMRAAWQLMLRGRGIWEEPPDGQLPVVHFGAQNQ